MKIFEKLSVILPIAIVIVMTLGYFFGEVSDVRFIKLCSLLTLTYSVFAYVEIVRLRREIKDEEHEQT